MAARGDIVQATSAGGYYDGYSYPYGYGYPYYGYGYPYYGGLIGRLGWMVRLGLASRRLGLWNWGRGGWGHGGWGHGVGVTEVGATVEAVGGHR